jgi:hypothetical protein
LLLLLLLHFFPFQVVLAKCIVREKASSPWGILRGSGSRTQLLDPTRDLQRGIIIHPFWNIFCCRFGADRCHGKQCPVELDYNEEKKSKMPSHSRSLSLYYGLLLHRAWHHHPLNLPLSIMVYCCIVHWAPSPSHPPSLYYGLLLLSAQRCRGPATKVRYQNNRGDGLVLIVIWDVTLWKSYWVWRLAPLCTTFTLLSHYLRTTFFGCTTIALLSHYYRTTFALPCAPHVWVDLLCMHVWLAK